MSKKNINRKTIDILKKQEICFQTTIDQQKENVFKGSFYLGIDPSGSKLHLGHIINLILAQQLSNLGMQMILVLGLFTGQIGDPSFKSKTRTEVSKTDLEINSNSIQTITKKIIKKLNIKTTFVKNSSWLEKIKLSDYIQIAKNFNLKTVLNSKIFLERKQQENPMYMHEIMYFTIQAYDFYHLNKNYNCNIQIGGQDQWINMTSGCTLISKLLNKQAHVITVPLLVDEKNQKVSKTSKNSHIYFINTDKSYIFTYINLQKLPQNCLDKFKTIFFYPNHKNTTTDNVIEKIFTLVYSKKHYVFAKLFLQNKEKILQAQTEKYSKIIDIYNKQNYNLKNIVKRFTNIEKNHHIQDTLKNHAIKINNKTISHIKEFYQHTKDGYNIIEITEYIYLYYYQN